MKIEKGTRETLNGHISFIWDVHETKAKSRKNEIHTINKGNFPN